jgi:hypothetical protein
MYPIYCGHPIIEKRMTDTGDLVVNCTSCHSVAMWHRSMIPTHFFQVPPPRLVGVLKTGLFAVPIDKLIHVASPESLEEFIRRNIIRLDLEGKFQLKKTAPKDLLKGDT